MSRALSLVSAPWVLPVERPPLREGALVLDDAGTILAIGARTELRTEYPNCPETRQDGIILPGLVNAHTHLELSVLEHLGAAARGSMAPAGFLDWAAQLARANAGVGPEIRLACAHAAIRTLHRSGVAAVADVGNGLSAVAAFDGAPLVGVFFHELLGARERTTKDALGDAERERAALERERPWPKTLRYTPAPHALYSADPPLLRRIFGTVAARAVPTTIHVAEDADEITFLRTGDGPWQTTLRKMGFDPAVRSPGCGPMRYLEALGAFATTAPPLLVHMVHADDEDLALAARYDATVILCPRSNLNIGGRLPDVPRMLRHGLRLGIGTDSLASSPSLAPLEELAVLARAFPDLPPAVWLDAATRGGGHALRLPVGVLRPGLRPGVIAIGLDHTGFDPETALVHAAAPTITWLAGTRSTHCPRTPAMTTTASPSPLAHLVAFGRMIKFSHSIFALPFALAAAALAARTHGITPGRILGIVVAMVAARTAAMGFNRIVDRHLDAQNPRTASRELPAGRLRLRTAVLATIASVIVFLAAAASLGPLCLALSPVALVFLLGYSYTKRFTWLCHIFLGLAIAGGPAGAWIAVTGGFGAVPAWLMLAVTTWIGGFDILYALSDREFDRAAGLYSIPARFGVVVALWISGLLHAIAAAALVLTGLAAGRGPIYFGGVAIVVLVLIWEHALVRPSDLSRLDMAFFTLNGYVSLVFFLGTLADLMLG